MPFSRSTAVTTPSTIELGHFLGLNFKVFVCHLTFFCNRLSLHNNHTLISSLSLFPISTSSPVSSSSCLICTTACIPSITSSVTSGCVSSLYSFLSLTNTSISSGSSYLSSTITTSCLSPAGSLSIPSIPNLLFS